MKNYFATFIPGFKNLIVETVKKDNEGIEIKEILESSLYFSCNVTYANLVHKHYFTNLFITLSFLKVKDDQSIASIFKLITKDVDITEALQNEKSDTQASSFRIMVQKGSKLVHIPKALRKAFAADIQRQSNLQYQPLKADVEIWILIRNERYAILGLKIAQESVNLHTTQKGELRPHMAHMLNIMSDPHKNDTYLDPFAGYGALPLDRANMPYKKICVSDNNQDLASQLQSTFKKYKQVDIRTANALNLTHIPDGSVHKIVTDPPWGIFADQEINYHKFYTNMLKEMSRVLKKDGILVILTAKTDAFEKSVEKCRDLSIRQRYTTLVNGKKATAYRLSR